MSDDANRHVEELENGKRSEEDFDEIDLPRHDGELTNEADDSDDHSPEAGGQRPAAGGAREQDRYHPEDDDRAIQALEFVQDVLAEMGMECKAQLCRPGSEDWSDEIHIEVVGRDSGRVIGKKGQVLTALQFLTHRVINRPGLDRRHVLVDAEGYRTRRDSQLSSMARKLGKQAVELGKVITFEPMNPRDRRVVHLALAKFDGVVTKSDGEGDDRRVQIIPVRR